MAYQKFIYKNGKKYGPYHYTSVREGGKVKTVYLGRKPNEKEGKISKLKSLFSRNK